MKISILTPNLSSNALGRAYMLAKVLQRRWAVEVIGPMFGKALWYPVAEDKSIKYRYIKVNRGLKTYWQLKQLLKEVTGDVIYASKPLMTSYGVGLFKKLTNKRPLILDIDDWELGLSKEFYIRLSLIGKVKNFISSFQNFFSYWNIFFMEKLLPLADEITVSNSFLQSKFGGMIIPHGRDTELLNPEQFDREVIKENLGLKNRRIISYIGTPRSYKGIEDLIESVSRVKQEDILLLLVGITDRSQKLCSLAEEKIGAKRVMFLGEQPITKIGEFWAISDIVVIPQKDSWATRGQIPAKIFDAMAMAKPIISTAVNDIPQILKGCGVVVKPGDIMDMTDKMDLLLNDKAQALKLGKKAREKCIEKYSRRVMEKYLFPIFEKYAK